MAILTEQKDTLSDLTEEDFGGTNGGGIQVGDGYFWILRPNYGDDNLPVYGFTEENAKLNINTASYESLMRLPNMTDDVASAIINWRGTATTGTSSSLAPLSRMRPAACKLAAPRAVASSTTGEPATARCAANACPSAPAPTMLSPVVTLRLSS